MRRGACGGLFGFVRTGHKRLATPLGVPDPLPSLGHEGFPDMPPTTARQARRQSRVAAALLLLSFLLLLAMVVLTSIGAPA